MLLEMHFNAGVAVVHGLGCERLAPSCSEEVKRVPIVDKAHARETIARVRPGLLLEVCGECREAGRLRVLVPNRQFDDD